MKAIIHIGAEKTGTTSIQEFCAQNRALLAQQGIHYPISLGASNHLRLAAYAIDDDKIDDVRLSQGLSSSDQVEGFREQLRTSLAAEIGAAGEVSTLIVSNEHLHSRLVGEDEVARLRSLIGAFADDIRILVYLRRQDRVAVSHYSTRLRADVDVDGPVIPPCSADQALPDYYDYDRMLRRYEAVFGAGNIEVRIFEPAHLLEGDLLRDFRARCGIAESADYVRPPRTNPSLSEVGIRFFQRFNVLAPRFVDGRPNPYRAGIQDAVTRLCIGPGPRVPRAKAEAFYQKFADGNRAINARYFPDSAGDLFDDDFADYDRGESHEMSEDEFIDLAGRLWLEQSRELVEMRVENALLRFQNAVWTGSKAPLPSLTEPPLDGSLPSHLPFRYLGALLYSLNFRRAADISLRLIDSQPRPVLILAHAFALLALGDEAAFERFVSRQTPAPKLTQSLTTLQAREIAARHRRDWMEFFRSGDAVQSMLYNRCFQWLEKGSPSLTVSGGAGCDKGASFTFPAASATRFAPGASLSTIRDMIPRRSSAKVSI